MMKLAGYFKQKNKGQSFVELAFVMLILLLLLAGMVEFGNLLNIYINLVDGAREGARFGSNNDPFYQGDLLGTYDYSAPQQIFWDNIFQIVEGDTNQLDPTKRTSAIAPIVLSGDGGVRSNGETYLGDDILATFYSVSGTTIIQKFGPKSKYHSGRESLITESMISGMLEPKAPATGILIVEIFYNYKQLLAFPFFTVYVPNPVPVHAYSFMPLAGAESTPTPEPP